MAAGPNLFDAILSGVAGTIAGKAIDRRAQEPAGAGPGLPFAVQTGAAGLAVQQTRNLARVPYRLGRTPATPNGEPDRVYLNIEGSFLYVDPMLSSGALRLSIDATQAGQAEDQITLIPGQAYSGDFKGVSIAPLDFAAGQIIFGRGALTPIPADSFRGVQVVRADRTYSDLQYGTYSVGIGNNLTAAGTVADSVAVRSLETYVTEGLAGASTPIPSSATARIFRGGISSPFVQGQMTTFVVSLNGAGNWVKHTAFRFPDVTFRDPGGLLAGTCLLEVAIQQYDGSVIVFSGQTVAYNRMLFL